MNHKKNTNDGGFSAVAAVAIGAVVIIGGAFAISATTGGEVDDTATTTQNDQQQEEANDAVFSCEGNQEVAVNFSGDNEATVTLPDGEVKSVTQVQADQGTRYESESESFVFINQGQEAAVRQNGEMILEGCTETGSYFEDEEAATSSEAEAQMETGVNAETEAEAETDVETETEVEDAAEVEANVESDTSVEAGTDTTVVTYTNDGFSSQTVSISAGDTVRFVNESSGGMWVGSDVHPNHSQYDGTSRSEHCTNGQSESFDQCGVGEVYEFTFDQTGSFGYHNHVNSSDTGTVVVE